MVELQEVHRQQTQRLQRQLEQNERFVDQISVNYIGRHAELRAEQGAQQAAEQDVETLVVGNTAERSVEELRNWMQHLMN